MRLLIVAFLLQAPLFGQTQRNSLDSLAWFTGCWSGGSGARTSLEQWMKPSGKTMLGMSRTVANDKTVEYEFLRLHEKPNGDIFYTALPSGQQETSFKLIRLDKHMAVFENPEHDFPQRIIYKLEDDGSLKARIEGKSKGKERGIDFPMKKVKCD
jgi:hypothetical protein